MIKTRECITCIKKHKNSFELFKTLLNYARKDNLYLHKMTIYIIMIMFISVRCTMENYDMDLLNVLREAGKSKNYKKTSNFYYEDHICEKSGNTIRIRLDYMLSNELTDDVLRFGVCRECDTCFYHNDFQSKGL